jgi:transcriptional regulator with XRE-family HTH domain
MARTKSFTPEKIGHNRKTNGMNQSAYWSRFGVTQSGGSRYESGRNIPLPTAMLMWLREAGKLTDNDLAAAMKAVQASKAKAKSE